MDMLIGILIVSIEHSNWAKKLGVMHIDIMGPMGASWSGDRYVVVAAWRFDGVGLVYNAHATKTKNVVETFVVVKEMIIEHHDGCA